MFFEVPEIHSLMFCSMQCKCQSRSNCWHLIDFLFYQSIMTLQWGNYQSERFLTVMELSMFWKFERDSETPSLRKLDKQCLSSTSEYRFATHDENIWNLVIPIQTDITESKAKNGCFLVIILPYSGGLNQGIIRNSWWNSEWYQVALESLVNKKVNELKCCTPEVAS